MHLHQRKIDSLLDTTRVALRKVGPKAGREERENHPAAPLTWQTPQSGDRLHIDPLINHYLQAAAQLDGDGEQERVRKKWKMEVKMTETVEAGVGGRGARFALIYEYYHII